MAQCYREKSVGAFGMFEYMPNAPFYGKPDSQNVEVDGICSDNGIDIHDTIL